MATRRKAEARRQQADPAKGKPDPAKRGMIVLDQFGLVASADDRRSQLTGAQLHSAALACSALWTHDLGETEQTSVRVPTVLRDAVRDLHELGLAPSFSEVLVTGANHVVEALAHNAGLEAHFAEHPELRPSVAEVAVALARLDASPLAARPELIEQAEAELVASGRAPTPDDVLIYADALLLHGVDA